MTERPDEFAYYYPEPYWGPSESSPLKNLLLFFDGIAILLPRYMSGRQIVADPVLAGPLSELGLLRVLEPESFVDQEVTERLADTMVELIVSDVFDDLERGQYGYQALSYSRMGWNADVQLADMLVEELMKRDLARPSEDGVSVPLHPAVRRTILVLLSQLVRDAGRRTGLELHPATSRPDVVEDLVSTLTLTRMPSAGHVIPLDLEVVGLNLDAVPLDEVLDFRKDHGAAYRVYSRKLREFLSDLALRKPEERRQLLVDRREELVDAADSLHTIARRAWRRPLATFSLGAAGAVWAMAAQNDPVTAALSLGSGIVGALPGRELAGAYSYLFSAQHQLGGRSGLI